MLDDDDARIESEARRAAAETIRTLRRLPDFEELRRGMADLMRRDRTVSVHAAYNRLKRKLDLEREAHSCVH